MTGLPCQPVTTIHTFFAPAPCISASNFEADFMQCDWKALRNAVTVMPGTKSSEGAVEIVLPGKQYTYGNVHVLCRSAFQAHRSQYAHPGTSYPVTKKQRFCSAFQALSTTDLSKQGIMSLIFFSKSVIFFPKPDTFFTICAEKICYKLCNAYYKLCNTCYKLSNTCYKVCNKNHPI